MNSKKYIIKHNENNEIYYVKYNFLKNHFCTFILDHIKKNLFSINLYRDNKLVKYCNKLVFTEKMNN